MSGTDPEADGPRDDDTLAGEFVLGVLDTAEMTSVRLRARAEPEFAAAIRAWEARLFTMTAAVEPVEPPAALWNRIERSIAPVPPRPANEDLPVAAPRRPDRWALRWQVATVAMAALAAGFAAIAFLPNPEPTPVRVAAIAPIGAPAPAFVAAARADGGLTLTSVSPAAVPAGRDLELWVLPPGAKTVAPLGLLPAQGRFLQLASVPATGTQLLISLEPAGGSTTGQPTGPVLYAGTLASR